MSKGIEMNRGLVVAVGASALVVAGLSGCSSGGTSSTSSANTKVTLDGQDQPFGGGSVTCVTQGGTVVIVVGDSSKGITASVTSGDSPEVQSVGMGSSNGVALVYNKAVPGGEAKATKDGSTYKISGKVTGADISQPGTILTKPFEMDVTCP